MIFAIANGLSSRFSALFSRANRAGVCNTFGAMRVLPVLGGLLLLLISTTQICAQQLASSPNRNELSPLTSVPSATSRQTAGTGTTATAMSSAELPFDEREGAATIHKGSTDFVLNRGALDVSKCAGQQISIYAASNVVLRGRERPWLTSEASAPLTTTIASCSGSTHGKTLVPASASVSGVDAQCEKPPFSPGCARWGTDVSGPINARIQANSRATIPNVRAPAPIGLPPALSGFVKDPIVPTNGTNLKCNGARLMSGWEGGYSSEYPSGHGVILIAGVSHTNRIDAVTVQNCVINNGLDFNWSPSGGIQTALKASFAQHIVLSHNRFVDVTRGIGVFEDADDVLLDHNSYSDCHEDCEHWGESYLPGDSVSHITSQYPVLDGYSDDGIAVVGGNVPCTTNLSAAGAPVTGSKIVHPIINGSHNPGGSWIYNCALQIGGNVDGVEIDNPEVRDPAFCALQLIDYFGGAPSHVQVKGPGHLDAGCMPNSRCNNLIDLGGPVVQISGEAGNNRFFSGSEQAIVKHCPVVPISDVTIEGLTMDMGAYRGITRHVGSPYFSSSVSGTCVSAIGSISNLTIQSNTCSNDNGATGNYGLYLDPDRFGAVPTGVALIGNTFNFQDASSKMLYNGTAGTVVMTPPNTVNLVRSR